VRRSGLEYGLPLQVLEIFTLEADDGIREQVVSCDAAEGDTAGGTGMLDRDTGLEETLGTGWLMKRHASCSKHTRAYTRLDICLMCRFRRKSRAARTFLSTDVS